MATRREVAVAVEETCPRCGTARAPEQDYCLECGLRLPVAVGTVASLRRGWVRRVGWYPGDWFWLALAALVVASAGAAAAIVLGRKHAEERPVTVVAPPLQVSLPTAATGRNGRTLWPRGLDGWTVVLGSSPATRGQTKPLALATGAARRGPAAGRRSRFVRLREPPPGLLCGLQRRLRSTRRCPNCARNGPSPRLRRCLCTPSRAVIDSSSDTSVFHLLPKKKSFVTYLRTR